MPEDNLLGERIKNRRIQLGLTLRKLSELTDVSAAFLSQIEHGQTNPSVNSLRRISEALGVNILYFLDDGSRHDPVVRANDRSSLHLSGSKVTYELLTPDLNRKFEVFLGHAGQHLGNFARPLRESTEECIFIQSGSLKIGLNTGEYVLNKGDSIYFDGRSLVEISNPSTTEEAVWISIITPPVF